VTSRRMFIGILMLLAFWLMWAGAEPVSSNQARAVAEAFLRRELARDWSYRVRMSLPEEIRVVTSRDLTDPSTGQLLAYVFDLEPAGYVVVPADDVIVPVIAYSFTGEFAWDENRQNILLYMLRKDLALRLEAARVGMPPSMLQEIRNQWKEYLEGRPVDRGVTAITVYGPWLSRSATWPYPTWHQDSPYNDFCPLDPVHGGRAVVGCVATAMAQILNYWQYPRNVSFLASDSYYTSTHGIWVDATTANFTNLNYNNCNPDNTAKARLSFAAGVSVRMDYCAYGSGAWQYYVAPALAGGHNPMAEWLGTVPQRWGYVSAEIRTYRPEYSSWGAPYYTSETSFYDQLAANMVLARPAFLTIYDSDSGHAVVVDGWKSGTREYHLNYGWGGSTDGWYVFPTGIPYFSIIDSAVLNIVPSTTMRTLNVNTTGTGSGTVEWLPSQTTFTHGTHVILLAKPAPGSKFVRWSGAVSGTQNPIRIIMDANKTVTAEFAVIEPGKQIAVTWPGYDNMAEVLRALGREYVVISPSTLTDLNALRAFSAVFVNCAAGLEEIADAAANSVRQYVQDGGVLYVSDYAFVFVDRAFPGYIQFAGYTGQSGSVNADVVDSGLANYLGASSLVLNFDLPSWVPVEAVGAGVQVYVEGMVSYAGKTAKKPIVVGFNYGTGKVVYTSFHNAKQGPVAARLMEYLALLAFTERLARELRDFLSEEGYEVTQDVRGFVAQGQSVAYEYAPAAGAQFKVGLNWPEESGATLRLSVFDSQGILVGLAESTTPPIWVEVSSLPPPPPPATLAHPLVTSVYLYVVTGVVVPGTNVEYASVVGETAKVIGAPSVEFDRTTYQPGDTVMVTVTDDHYAGATEIIGTSVLVLLDRDDNVIASWERLEGVVGQPGKFRVAYVLPETVKLGTITAVYTDPLIPTRVAQAQARVVLFFCDFENFTGWIRTGLWHICSERCFDCGGLVGKYAHYAAVRDGTCTCSYDTGRRTLGYLTSPVITVPQNTELVLMFDFARFVENYPRATRDRTYVQIRLGRGSWRTVWSRSSRNPSPECGTSGAILIRTGQYTTLQIRFVFDSLNRYNNNFPGWAVDNIMILPRELLSAGIPLAEEYVEEFEPLDEEEPFFVLTVFPNPVTGRTVVFGVDGVEAEALQVEVYDLGGRLVYKAETLGGQLTWDTLDFLGQPVANGVYLVLAKVKVDGEWLAADLQKILILR